MTAMMQLTNNFTVKSTNERITAGWQTPHCVSFPKMLGMWSPERMTRRNIKPSSCE